MGNKVLHFLVVFVGFMTLLAPLMGCQPRSPALSAAEVQAQQQREINTHQAQLAEDARKLICLKAANLDVFAMLAQVTYRITCKSGE